MDLDRATILCAALLLLAFIGSAPVQAQDSSSAPRKFDEFADLRTDDIQARLDGFAKEIRKDEQLQGFIVGYHRTDRLPGSFLREYHGFREYMLNLAVRSDRIDVIDGGFRDHEKTELWLAPVGTSFPTTHKTPAVQGVMEFDYETLGFGCESEYTLVLEEPSDLVRFFGEAMRRNPDTKGHVAVHPSRELKSSQAAKLAATARKSLLSEYGISSDRISTSVELSRACASLNLWLAPTNLPFPTGNPRELFFYSQLMSEAEQNNYTVRRVTFVGNASTRDQVIRRRLLQNEGDIFKRTLLEQSLKAVSQLKNFRPVTIQDVEVHLDREEKTIDFLINLTERTGGRQRRTQ